MNIDLTNIPRPVILVVCAALALIGLVIISILIILGWEIKEEKHEKGK